MPLFFVSFGAFIASALSGIVGRVAGMLGLSLVAYQGIEEAIAALKNLIASSFNGLPANMLSMLSMMSVDSAISIILSAYLSRLVIKGLVGGARRIQ